MVRGREIVREGFLGDNRESMLGGDQMDYLELDQGSNARIKVVGCGGGGGNAVENMITSATPASLLLLPTPIFRPCSVPRPNIASSLATS